MAQAPTKNFVALLPALAQLAPAWAAAATLCVNPGGTGGCFATLQSAVDASASGDTIEIAAGTFPQATLLPERCTLIIRGAGSGDTFLEDGLTLGDRCRVTLSDLTIRNASDRAIIVGEKATLDLADGIVEDNFRGIHLGLRSKATLERVTLRGNEGEGIAGGKRIRIDDSTISGNGVGVAGSRAVVRNSTISGNEIGVRSVRANLESCTVAGNVTGLHLDSDTRYTIANTIVADNSLDCRWGDFGKPRLVSQGFNLIENLHSCVVTGSPTGNLIGVDPLLGPLAPNGGPTETHALGAGSVAIDAGNPKPPGKGSRCPPLDQRGVPRNGRCDIGAFEF